MNPQDALERDAQANGERLALLLSTANLPEDVKAGFAAMIPEMTLEQLDRLMNILENNIQDTTAAEEQNLIAAIKNTQDEYEQKRKAVEENTLKEIEELTNGLNQID